jgi:hypothetical protein
MGKCDNRAASAAAGLGNKSVTGASGRLPLYSAQIAVFPKLCSLLRRGYLIAKTGFLLASLFPLDEVTAEKHLMT